MTGRTVATQSFNTGWPIIGRLLLLSLFISGWITWDIWHDPSGQFFNNLADSVGFFIMFNSLMLVIGILTAWQRVVLDFTTWTLHYANISTLHRWKAIPLRTVQSVTFLPAIKRPKAGVDHLELRLTAPPGQAARTVTLLDGRIMPIFNVQPSALFSAVVNFVQAGQPRATLPEKLVP